MKLLLFKSGLAASLTTYYKPRSKFFFKIIATGLLLSQGAIYAQDSSNGEVKNSSIIEDEYKPARLRG